MRPEWQAHIDELLEQYRKVRDNLGRMQREMAELTATAESDDGMVRATVGFHGELTKLELNPRAYRVLDTETLGEVIVATTRKAAAQVRQLVNEVVSPNLPDVAGLRGMTGDFDFTKLFPTDPADLPAAREVRPRGEG
jgi:DNA-binding protein YbaB